MTTHRSRIAFVEKIHMYCIIFGIFMSATSCSEKPQNDVLVKQAQLINNLSLSTYSASHHPSPQETPNAALTKTLNAPLNFNWQFTLGDPVNAEKNNYDDSQWRTLQLPHDWSIESKDDSSPFSSSAEDQYDTGYASGGVGWYRKTFALPIELHNKRLLLKFGGIYLNASIFINGKKIGAQHNGYTSFWVELTDHLRLNALNTLAVRVHNNHRNSRWYSGSGIYRPITLVVKNTIDTHHWDTQVTPAVYDDGSASINVKTRFDNVTHATHAIVLHSTIVNPTGSIIASTKNRMTLPVGQKTFEHTLKVPSPRLWHPHSPQLYQLHTRVESGLSAPSSTVTTFGIRKLHFDSDHGLFLNDIPLLLKGMNLHHDNYMLGSAAYARAEERKVERILAAGYNAVRTSHNPPSEAFLHAADRLGLLVINEAFDAWNKQKWDHSNDYAAYFKHNWKIDVDNFIYRDINHPSVIMWSLGNEIPEQNTALGATTAAELTAYIKTLDASRPTTIGANTSGEKADPFLNTFDVVGYNYEEKNYLSDRQRNPNRLMYGSETYPNKAFDYWQYVEQYPFIIGDFVWTGWDYLGEAGIGWTGYGPQWKGLAPFPWHLAYCGEIDALGYKRPAGIYRDVLWKTGQNTLSMFVKSPTPSYTPEPYKNGYDYWVHPDLHPNWTWPNTPLSTPLDVVVYSVHEEVELLLNGKSLGKRPNSASTQWTSTFRAPYQPGILEARGYHHNKVVETQQLITTQHATSFTIMPDRTSIKADGQDLSYLTVQLTDSDGHFVYQPLYDLGVTFTIDGPATLIGIGNGNPVSQESFQSLHRKTHHGKLVAVLRSQRNNAGQVNITLSSKSLGAKTITIETLRPN